MEDSSLLALRVVIALVANLPGVASSLRLSANLVVVLSLPLHPLAGTASVLLLSNG